MKPTHDSPLLRVSSLRTHQTVFNKENSYHLVYILQTVLFRPSGPHQCSADEGMEVKLEKP